MAKSGSLAKTALFGDTIFINRPPGIYEMSCAIP